LLHHRQPTRFDPSKIKQIPDQALEPIDFFSAHRNRLDLIRAFARLVELVPDAVLLVVGAVSDPAPALLADSLGLGDKVKFAGARPHAEIPGLLAIADLEAHWLNQDVPSRTSLGVASMEAMAAGRTVLTAANPDTFGPGVLENGHNFICVEPGRPEALAALMAELLRDEVRRERIGREARKTAERHFSWQSVTDLVQRVYGGVRARSCELGAA